MQNILIFFGLIMIGVIGHAKIGDPPGVYSKGVIFCGHANKVFALKTKNKNFECNSYVGETKGLRKIWETELPFKVEPDKYDPLLEEDAQWCIVSGLSLDKETVVASNCHGEKFRLNQKNGQLITK